MVTKHEGKIAKKEQQLTYRLKNKDLTICWICGMGTDWIMLKKSEAGLLQTRSDVLETCNTCRDAIHDWVSMICLGQHCHTKEPCNSFYVLDETMIQKYVPEAEKGSTFEIYGCASCSPDRKLHLTKESVNEAYKTFNNNLK